jgi:hypothetical protein
LTGLFKRRSTVLARSNAGSKPEMKETGFEYSGIVLHAEYSQMGFLLALEIGVLHSLIQ